MNITGAERILFGVDDLAETRRFLSSYGLTEVDYGQTGCTFNALDGSGVDVRLIGDTSLPTVKVKGPTMNLAIWGVDTPEDLQAIAAELTKDREVVENNGVLLSHDDDGNPIGFKLSARRAYESSLPVINVAGHAPARFNQRVDFGQPGKARQLGHVVYFSPDPDRAIRFYIDRLQFRLTDTFVGSGHFARSKGHSDHHSLFLIKLGTMPPCFHHAEFTFGDAQEVFTGGHNLTKLGYKTASGPGRFECGSNWYWYFKTPMGGAFELGADMDQVDDDWVPGVHEDRLAVVGWKLDFDLEKSRY